MARARSSTSQWSRPGPLGEVGGDGQHLGAGQRQRSIQLGEAQVVADRQADRDAIDVGARPVASPAVTRADSVSTGPGVDRDVEQVDLAVRRRDRAVRGDQHARVVGASSIAGRLGDAADEDPGVVPAGDLGERLRVRSRDGSRGGAEAVVGAAELEVLRQGDETGAAGRGLGRERRGASRCWRRRRPSASSWTRATGRRMAAHRTARRGSAAGVGSGHVVRGGSPLSGLSLHWPGGKQSVPSALALPRGLRLPAVPLLLGPAGMPLADALPATGPRWLARGAEARPVDGLDIDLVLAGALRSGDRDALADERLERVVGAVEPARPGIEDEGRAAGDQWCIRCAVGIRPGRDGARDRDVDLRGLVGLGRLVGLG